MDFFGRIISDNGVIHVYLKILVFLFCSFVVVFGNLFIEIILMKISNENSLLTPNFCLKYLSMFLLYFFFSVYL